MNEVRRESESAVNAGEANHSASPAVPATPPTSARALKQRQNIVRGMFSSMVGTLLSRVLGAWRDIAISHSFGATTITDVFFVAQTVPAVFRRFIADEGLTGALIPALAREEEQVSARSAKHLSDIAFTALLIAASLLTVAGIALSPQLVKLFGYGYVRKPEQFQLAVTLTQWMFPFVIMVSLVSFFEAVLNLRQHFFVPKLAPGLAAGVLGAFALWATGYFSLAAYALPVGVLVGGVLHLLICLPVTARLWGLPRFSLNFRHPQFIFLAKEMGKVAAIGLLAQINIMLLRSIATLLVEGSVTYYWYANRLVDLSTGMIAVGVGSALMPAISNNVVNKDWDGFRSNLVFSIRLTSFMLLPTAAVFLSFSYPIVSMMFRHGEFTASDCRSTALTTVCMVPFFLSMAGINIIKRAYFALDDRTCVLIVGAGGTVLTGVAGYVMSTKMGVAGLALALSLSTALQFAAYLAWLPLRLNAGPLYTGLIKPLAKMILASAPTVAILALAGRVGVWESGPAALQNWLVGLLGLALAAGAYGYTAHLMKLPELDKVLRRFRRKKTAR